MNKIRIILLTILLITIVFLIEPTVYGYSETKSVTKIEDLNNIFTGQIENSIFKLTGNITLSDMEINFESSEYTIDLNGNKIEMKNSLLNICGVKLKIKDSSTEKSGSIISDSAIAYISEGNLIIENGNFESINGESQYFSAFYLDGGNMEIQNGKFLDESDIIGVINSKSKLDIKNGEFISDGILIWADAGEVNISGGVFSSTNKKNNLLLGFDSYCGLLNVNISNGSFESIKTTLRNLWWQYYNRRRNI